MAGGTWVVQDKKLPGFYTKSETEGNSSITLGERGIVTFPMELPWGAEKQLITLTAGEDTTSKLGYSILDPEMLPIREAYKEASTTIVYRTNVGVKASATLGTRTFTAKHSGELGNSISIVIENSVDDPENFTVITLLNGAVVDRQTVTELGQPTANDYVEFGGTGELTSTAALPLTGGTNGTSTNQDHVDYTNAIQVIPFNTIALSTEDATLKSFYVSYVKRMIEDEGKKVQVAMNNYPTADYEGVISVKNGVVLSDGTVVDSKKSVYWTAAATAGAQINEALTYRAYPDAVDTDIKYTRTELEQAVDKGEFVFIPFKDGAVVQYDINTFTSFTPKKDKRYSKNRVLRVLNGSDNDLKQIFEEFYVGKADNHPDGRNLLKGEYIKYFRTLEGIGAIQNFNPQTDIVISQGTDTDAVYVDRAIQPVDSIDKIYEKVKVK